jgi:hypothetical protein
MNRLVSCLSLGWKWLTVANTPAFYNVTTVKSFVVLPLGESEERVVLVIGLQRKPEVNIFHVLEGRTDSSASYAQCFDSLD